MGIALVALAFAGLVYVTVVAAMAQPSVLRAQGVIGGALIAMLIVVSAGTKIGLDTANARCAADMTTITHRGSLAEREGK